MLGSGVCVRNGEGKSPRQESLWLYVCPPEKLHSLCVLFLFAGGSAQDRKRGGMGAGVGENQRTPGSENTKFFPI
ncbi:unnamed protein product [Bursaphelenchus xylophilus]|uniref:(pine wood nematode) hypothetical protein n=1 Tax=Bursaphelenchus xylophilus TaxID=6326 RepID=A0A1I7RR48_BURXY|nr:unnamed protein product [Bursaphelenchus xylophilus]CAG9130839.1 unnamed protein product [Bursaphelenchus xylophilus]